MRITKKYAGASCIGKQVFQLSESYYECFQENERELQRLENLFLLRINGKGLMGKRAGGGSADVPTPHQSIYETTNFDQAPASNALQLKRVVLPKKKTPMKAASGGNSAKSPSEKARRQQLLQQEYVNAMYGDGLGGGDASYPGNHHHPHSNSYASFLAMNSEGGGGSDDDEGSQGDYGYSYDPDQEDPANPGGQFPYEGSSSSGGLRAGASSVNGALSAGAGAGAGAGTGGVYSSFRAGGRRVLSAPNLTELNLSSWKATDYRPMPAESLKEMFSLPLGSGAGGNNHRGNCCLFLSVSLRCTECM